MMKKMILTAVLASAAIGSMNANAATGTAAICTGASIAGSGVAVTSATDTFVKVSFTPKCSSNVQMIASDNGTYYGVGSASTKGKTAWVGSTNGGGITKNADCAATGCTSSDALNAVNAAPAS